MKMLEGIKNIIKSKSRTFLVFCFCFVLGVTIASGLELEKSTLFYLFILIWLVLFFLISFWKQKVFRFGLLSTLFFIFGMARVLVFLPDINKSHIAFYNGETKDFIGKVVKEPDVRISKSYYVVSVMGIVIPTEDGGRVEESLKEKLRDPSTSVGMTNEVSGRVKITTQLYPEYDYGDVLKIKCKLQSPENKEGAKFKYDKYLALEKVYSVCYYPSINYCKQQNCHFEELKNPLRDEEGSFTFVQDDSGVIRSNGLVGSFYKKIFIFKSKIANQINLLWSEPESSFMAGLLYGYRGGFPESLQQNFNKTGLTHIVAISGFNISIISIALMFFLIYIGLYRKQAFWITILGIFLFVVFVGSSASVVRAGVMGSLVLLANYIGRPSKVFNVIILTLVLMLIINPLSLLYDVGFQLSFVAVLGLIYLSPIIEEKMSVYIHRTMHRHFLELVIKLLSATLSAIIITLPLILYFFERFSTVALITNILVLWIIPWLMLFGFLSLILSWIFLPLGLVMAWVVNIGLKYVIILVNWFGGKSWSSWEFTMPFYMVFVLYVLLIIWYIRKK